MKKINFIWANDVSSEDVDFLRRQIEFELEEANQREDIAPYIVTNYKINHLEIDFAIENKSFTLDPESAEGRKVLKAFDTIKKYCTKVKY